MRYVLSLVIGGLLLSGCGMSANEEAQNQANALREKSQQAIEKSKQTADTIKAKSEDIRNELKTKTEKAEAALQQIKEAEDATSQVFSGRYRIDMEREKSDLCLTTDECIVVEFAGCCSKVRAINKANLQKYNVTAAWQKDDTDCSLVECEDISEYTQTACRPDLLGAQRCILTKP